MKFLIMITILFYSTILQAIKPSEVDQFISDNQWKTGMIFGASERGDAMTMPVHIFSQNMINHGGIIRVRNGVPYIVEQTFESVKEIPLKEFILRSTKTEELSYRLVEPNPPLSSDEMGRLESVLDDYMERKPGYNFRFVMKDSCADKMQCGEFTRNVFRDIGRDNIGGITNLEELPVQSFNDYLRQTHLRVPIAGKAVLPGSSFYGDGVRVVATNLNFDNKVLPHEVLKEWTRDGDLEPITGNARAKFKKKYGIELPPEDFNRRDMVKMLELLSNEAEHPQLKSLLAEIHGLNKVQSMPMADLLMRPVVTKKEAMPSFKVGDKEFAKPKNIAQMFRILDEVHEAIEAAPEGSIKVSIDDKDYTLKTPALGAGNNGVVFDAGNGEVLKLPRSRPAALSLLQEEQELFDFWKTQQDKYGTFDVPKRGYTSPLGLFTTAEKNGGETLTETLLRHKVIELDDQLNPTLNPRSEWTLSKQSADKIESGIKDLVKAMKTNLPYTASLSPNNIHITFVRDEVSKVTFIDLGRQVMPQEDVKLDDVKRLVAYESAESLLGERYGEVIQRANKLEDLREIPGLRLFNHDGVPHMTHSFYLEVDSLDEYLELAPNRYKKYISKGLLPPSLSGLHEQYKVIKTGKCLRRGLVGF